MTPHDPDSEHFEPNRAPREPDNHRELTDEDDDFFDDGEERERDFWDG